MNGCYFIPHCLSLAKEKGEIIGSLHINYLAAQKDPSPTFRDWLEHDLEISKKLNIRILAESKRNKKVAENLGVKISKSIPPGINYEQFSDSGRRGNIPILNIMLYCIPGLNKGLDFGCQVIKRLKEDNLITNKFAFSSIGLPTLEYQYLFDNQYGYLHGNDYPNALKEIDIFIWPEQYSGFATPPLHAMACGCALVTTLIDGTEEYGIHKENCMMAMPDDLETMVNNVKKLITDVKLRDKIRENGLQTVKNYSWESSVDKLIGFLEENSVSC
jgi:glycosyltransferase involved in cell wall biosynthesis